MSRKSGDRKTEAACDEERPPAAHQPEDVGQDEKMRRRDAKINRILIIAAAMLVIGGSVFRGIYGFLFAAVVAIVLYFLSPEGAGG